MTSKAESKHAEDERNGASVDQCVLCAAQEAAAEESICDLRAHGTEDPRRHVNRSSQLLASIHATDRATFIGAPRATVVLLSHFSLSQKQRAGHNMLRESYMKGKLLTEAATVAVAVMPQTPR